MLPSVAECGPGGYNLGEDVSDDWKVVLSQNTELSRVSGYIR